MGAYEGGVTPGPGRERRVLNVGSGPRSANKLHPAFRRPGWREVRLDIDPAVRPDILGSAEDLSQIGDGSFDAIWSSHNLEHLHSHQVPGALRELVRVLRPDGFALITCPDLTAIAQLVVKGSLEAPAYVSPAGPITPLDMLFGHARSVEGGNAFMAHNTGFTADRLGRLLAEAGFAQVHVGTGRWSDLWAVALLRGTDSDQVRGLLDGTAEAGLLRGEMRAGEARAAHRTSRIPKISRIIRV